jgi:hypothetical protein
MIKLNLMTSSSRRRDPFFQKIIQGLQGPLDRDLFEEYAVDVLREVYPTLAPMPGGQDMGMDGAFTHGEEGFLPLITTTQQNVLANLRKSVLSYIKKGYSGRKAIVATSQALTARRKGNLKSEAEAHGFELLNIFGQAYFAQQLYRDPKWYKEILQITGAPPALSTIPLKGRHFIEIPPIGRGKELDWLRNRSGEDRLLVGEPGIGKTFLLNKIALEGLAFFVVSDNLGKITDDIRELNPEVLIVDDAQINGQIIEQLIHYRKSSGAEFQILASCWPQFRDDISRALEPTTENILELTRLPRDQMKEVISSMGVSRPLSTIAFFINQAEGRPGLAAVLVKAYLQGSIAELNSGGTIIDASLSWIDHDQRMQAKQILAAFSIGGKSGMELDVVAEFLQLDYGTIQRVVSELAAGGIVQFWNKQVIVRPTMLRDALVKEIFFSEASLPHKHLIEKISSPDDLVLTLIGVRARGGQVPNKLIQNTLVRSSTQEAWIIYAWQGPSECRWILVNHPEHLCSVARPMLEHIPDDAIPELLFKAIDDNRPIHSYPEHPLRQISDWIKSALPGSGESLPRRRTLLKAITKWYEEGKDQAVGLQALSLVLDPSFEEGALDPIETTKFYLRSSVITMDEVGEIVKWWPEILAIITGSDIQFPGILYEMVRGWTTPFFPGISIPDNQYKLMNDFAKTMLGDLAAFFKDQPEHLIWISKLDKRLGNSLNLSLPQELEVLFGDQDFSSENRWREKEQDIRQQIQSIGSEWAQDDPDIVSEKIKGFAEQTNVGGNYEERITQLCTSIAEKTSRPDKWIIAFLHRDLNPRYTFPFFSKFAKLTKDQFCSFAEDFLDLPPYNEMIFWLVLGMEEPSGELLDKVMTRLTSKSLAVNQMSMGSKVPDSTLAQLLKHSDPAVAGAAAIYEWDQGAQGKVRPEFQRAFREAILNIETIESPDIYFDHMLEKVLSSDLRLASEWLDRRLTSSFSRYRDREFQVKIASRLSQEVKKNLLPKIPNNYQSKYLAAALVGNDLDMFKLLTSLPLLKEIILAPLCIATNDENWPQMVHVAKDAGYSELDIVERIIYGLDDIVDSSAESFQKIMNDFNHLRESDDSLIQRVGKEGIKQIKPMLKEAQDADHRRNIFGDKY